MEHLTPDVLQRYLDGETDLTEAEAVLEHLAGCSACSDLLAAIAADDTALAGALALEKADVAWLQGVDLTEPVLRQVSRRHRAAVWVIAGSLLTTSGWMLEQILGFLAQLGSDQGPVALTVTLGRSLVPALWQFTRYLMQGGLAASLWPLLLLGAFALFRHMRKKEGNRYA